MTEHGSDREAVTEIFAQQDEVVRRVINEVLSIERSKLHLPHHDKAIADLLANALRGLVS